MGRVTSKLAKVIAIATVMLFVLSTVALAAMPNGTVVLGNKAFNLDYANNSANQAEITQAVVNAGNKIYVKGFSGNWVDNNTGNTVDPSAIPAVTYKDASGKETQYNAGDGDVVTAGELKVVSVSAINAKQVQVVFSQAVDKTSAETIGNYYIQRASDSTPVTVSSVDSTAVASLQDDGKTVVVTATNNIAVSWGVNKGTAFNFIVSGVKDSNGNAAPKFTQVLVNNDTTAPTLVSVTSAAATSSKNVTAKFSEPVDLATGVFTINGKTASVTAGSDPCSVIVTAQDNLTAGQTYTLSVINLKDFGGNLINPNPASLNFTVASDTVNQGVSSVTTKGDKYVNIVFAEKQDPMTVNTTNVKVLDGNGDSVGAVYSIAATPGDTTGTKYTITFNNASIFNSQGVANLQIVFTSNLKDMAGNAMTPSTQNVSLTKDTTAPTIQSVSYVLPNGTYDGSVYANGAFVFKASENLAAQATLARSNLVVVDQDGTDQTSTIFTADPITGVVLNSKDSTCVVVPLAAAMPSTVKTVNIRVAAGAFTDASLGANASVANVLSNIDVSNGIGSSDTIKPVLANAAGNTAAGNVETITYDITEANLDTSSVLNLNNYRLDGTVLPAGTYVTITGTAPNYTATIHLPQNTISTTRTNYAFTVSGIADKSGNVADTLAVNNISLTDNTQPVLTAGKINSDGTITVTFSEGVTGTTPADLVVKMNGSAAIDPAQLVVSDITTGADNGAELVQIKVAFDDPNATPSSGDEIIYVDVNNNGTLDAGDITIATGTYASAAAYNGGYVKASDFDSLVIGTKTTGIASGHDVDGNTLVINKTVTVK